MSTRLTQHEVRKVAVQYLYSLEMRQDQAEDRLLNYILDGRSLSEENIIYFEELISGIQRHQKEIDAELSKYLLDTWSMERLTTIDLVILRLGAEEILNTDLPDIVAIDEAINLTKDFSDEAASRLINGILTNLIKKNEN